MLAGKCSSEESEISLPRAGQSSLSVWRRFESLATHRVPAGRSAHWALMQHCKKCSAPAHISRCIIVGRLSSYCWRCHKMRKKWPTTYGPRQVKKCLWTRKCADSNNPAYEARYHPGLCVPFIHSVISNDSVSGQWRPWSDLRRCAGWSEPSLSTYTEKHVFAWPVFVQRKPRLAQWSRPVSGPCPRTRIDGHYGIYRLPEKVLVHLCRLISLYQHARRVLFIGCAWYYCKVYCVSYLADI